VPVVFIPSEHPRRVGKLKTSADRPTRKRWLWKSNLKQSPGGYMYVTVHTPSPSRGLVQVEVQHHVRRGHPLIASTTSSDEESVGFWS
jgi:hypothetical protein